MTYEWWQNKPWWFRNNIIMRKYRRLELDIRFWLSSHGWFSGYFYPLRMERARYAKMGDKKTPEQWREMQAICRLCGSGDEYVRTDKEQEEVDAFAMKYVEDFLAAQNAIAKERAGR